MALSDLKKRRFTADEYLELERKAEYKSEYINGDIFSHASKSESHNLIVSSVLCKLADKTERKFKLFVSQMRFFISGANCYVYPDVSMVCGETIFSDDRKDTITNPTIIIEVLSPSSEAYDRGDKFEAYRTLTSLQSYILISQDRVLIEVFERQDKGSWVLNAAKGLEAVAHVASIDCDLGLANIYTYVNFDKGADS